MQDQDKITQEDAASYLESDAYAKLPQDRKDRVIQFLKKNMVRQTMGTPDVAGDVQARREQTRGTGFAVEGIEEAKPKSVAGRLVKGGARGVMGVAGLPLAVEEAATTPPTEYEKGRHLRHPFVFAEPQKGAGLTLDRLFFDPQFREASKAKESFKEGKVSEGLAHGGASVIPGLGPYAAGIGEQLGKGEWAEALGEQAIYALTGLATKKMLKGVDPSKRLSAAAGGGAKEFESVMGDLAQSAKKYGKPKTVNDLYELVKNTGRDLETDFSRALQPIAGSQIMPSDVAANLLKEANKFDIHTPEGRAARLYLRQRALDYQKPWTLGDLNQKRMKMLDATLEDKTQVKQMGAVRGNVERLADKTIEDSLRDIVYGEMDRRYKGANFRDLKEKQAKLLDLNHRLQNRVSDIADKQAAYETAGPLKRMGFYVRGHASGLTPAVHPKFEGSPEKAASRQIKKGFSRLRSPIKAKPLERRLPPLEPETPSSPQTPPKSSPSATTGHPIADSDIAGYRKNIEKEWGNYPASFTGEGLRRSGQIPENVSLRDLEKKGFIKQNEEGLWDIVKHPESDVEEIRRRGPGENPEDAKARERQTEFLRTKRENLAGQKKEVPQKAADIRKPQEQPPKFISLGMEQDLKAKGYSMSDIDKMTPSEAHKIAGEQSKAQLISSQGSRNIKNQVFNPGDEITTSDGRKGKVIATYADGKSSLLVDFGKGKGETVVRDKIASFKVAGEHGSEIAKAANENSPEQARYYQEQAAKRLFNKSYEELDELQRIKTLSEGAKLQDAARKAKQSYAEWKGKGVTVKGKPGTVIGTSFGSLAVKLSDDTIVRVTPEEVKPGLTQLESKVSAPIENKKFLTQKQITANIGRTVTVGGEKMEIVGFPMGRVKVRAQNGPLKTVDWKDIEEPLK